MAEHSRDSTDAGPETPRWSGSAFGLNLESDLPVTGLEPGPGRARGPTRVLKADAEEIDAGWQPGSAERLADQRYPDGSVMMTVDAHPERGVFIDAPGHGRFCVAADGGTIECAPSEGPAWRWHRPFFAQALPIASALKGFEVLHASGVVIEGRALAFVGHSGAGKTSLAVHLVNQGAELLADDVVALSPSSGGVSAHPGVRFANIVEEQYEAIPAERRERFGRVIGQSEKLHIVIGPMAQAAAPLTALYFLERRLSVEELSFERLNPPDPARLLAATFLSHVNTPARLTAQLEVCAAIAAGVPTFTLRVPPDLSAPQLAPLVARHNAEVEIGLAQH